MIITVVELQAKSDSELYAWLHAVQETILAQCKLRSTTSYYFSQEVLNEKVAREVLIIKELRLRGLSADFTAFTAPRLTVVE